MREGLTLSLTTFQETAYIWHRFVTATMIRPLRGDGLALICSFLLWSETSLAQQAPAEGTIALFDGATLAGWTSVGNADWQVVDGMIEAQGGGDGFLVTDIPYAGYRLTVEFWVDGTTNSGVFIGCPPLSEPNPKDCYEFNIWDNHPTPQARTGSIVFEVMPPLAHENTVGKWNTYEITSVASHLVVRLNGTVTAILDKARPDPGHIALQHAENGTVRFRKLYLYPQIIK